jgi:hypothetical protein
VAEISARIYFRFLAALGISTWIAYALGANHLLVRGFATLQVFKSLKYFLLVL